MKKLTYSPPRLYFHNNLIIENSISNSSSLIYFEESSNGVMDEWIIDPERDINLDWQNINV